jgi:hypothetical protein
MLNNSSDKIKKEFENLRNELLDLTLRNQLLQFQTNHQLTFTRHWFCKIIKCIL